MVGHKKNEQRHKRQEETEEGRRQKKKEDRQENNQVDKAGETWIWFGQKGKSRKDKRRKIATSYFFYRRGQNETGIGMDRMRQEEILKGKRQKKIQKIGENKKDGGGGQEKTENQRRRQSFSLDRSRQKETEAWF